MYEICYTIPLSFCVLWLIRCESDSRNSKPQSPSESKAMFSMSNSNQSFATIGHFGLVSLVTNATFETTGLGQSITH